MPAAADDDAVRVNGAYRRNDCFMISLDDRPRFLHRFVPRLKHDVGRFSVVRRQRRKKGLGRGDIVLRAAHRMPVNNRIYPVGDARVHHSPDFVDFIRGISLVGAGQDGDPDDGAFPILGKVVDGAGIEKLRPLRGPAIQRHSMQRDGVAVFINNLGSLDIELAVNADKCLRPGFDCLAAHANKRQTGKRNQGNT